MKNYLINNRAQAQSTIEFSLALILAVLFLFLSSNLFVWFNRTVVQRQVAYEASRSRAAISPYMSADEETDPEAKSPPNIKALKSVADPGKTDFFTNKTNPAYKPLNVFTSGGYNK